MNAEEIRMLGLVARQTGMHLRSHFPEKFDRDERPYGKLAAEIDLHLRQHILTPMALETLDYAKKNGDFLHGIEPHKLVTIADDLTIGELNQIYGWIMDRDMDHDVNTVLAYEPQDNTKGAALACGAEAATPPFYMVGIVAGHRIVAYHAARQAGSSGSDFAKVDVSSITYVMPDGEKFSMPWSEEFRPAMPRGHAKALGFRGASDPARSIFDLKALLPRLDSQFPVLQERAWHIENFAELMAERFGVLRETPKGFTSRAEFYKNDEMMGMF